MIEQELILLGLLKEGPAHGYQIKKKINEVLFLFAGIKIKSIYYPLRILEKKNLVIKKKDKSGKRPQRFVYVLTPKGEARFLELLEKSFLDFKRPQFSLDLSLYFLPYIKPPIARRRLWARLRVLARITKWIKGMILSNSQKKSKALRYILEHNLKMIEAEASFLKTLLQNL